MRHRAGDRVRSTPETARDSFRENWLLSRSFQHHPASSRNVNSDIRGRCVGARTADPGRTALAALARAARRACRRPRALVGVRPRSIGRENDRHRPAPAAADALGGLFGAMSAGGGTSQTAVVRALGGVSQKASIVTATTSVATMLVLGPILGLLPQAVLAAVVIVYSIGLIDPAEFAEIRRVRTMEFTWALAAVLGVLVFGTLQGIVVAIVLSLVALSSQAANPKVYVIGRKRGADVPRPLSPEHPDDETFEGLLILRPEGRIFFANAQLVGEQIRLQTEKHRPKVLALDMSRVPDLEYTALQMLIEGERGMKAGGGPGWPPA